MDKLPGNPLRTREFLCPKISLSGGPCLRPFAAAHSFLLVPHDVGEILALDRDPLVRRQASGPLTELAAAADLHLTAPLCRGDLEPCVFRGGLMLHHRDDAASSRDSCDLMSYPRWRSRISRRCSVFGAATGNSVSLDRSGGEIRCRSFAVTITMTMDASIMSCSDTSR